MEFGGEYWGGFGVKGSAQEGSECIGLSSRERDKVPSFPSGK